tara:strand:- start:5208 stop:5615 length:408 start_codon:yes stop_codon:yes gene_type:complete
MAIDIFTPIIKELEELARKHPDPEVRANIYHMIDVLHGSKDEEMLELMHQFYHLREQLREEDELRKLRESSTVSSNMIPDPVEEGNEFYFEFEPDFDIPGDREVTFVHYQAESDEDEYNELVQAQQQWGLPVGEA